MFYNCFNELKKSQHAKPGLPLAYFEKGKLKLIDFIPNSLIKSTPALGNPLKKNGKYFVFFYQRGGVQALKLSK